MIAIAIKVNVATAMPSENETKLELYPSVTHITVVVFLSTVKLLISQVADTWYYEISHAKKLLWCCTSPASQCGTFL